MKGATARLGWLILRLMLVIHSLAVLSESVFAGQFLSGEDSQVKFHELTGWIVLAICAIQIVFAALLLRTGITSLWLVFSSFFLFLAEGLQIGTGLRTIPQRARSAGRHYFCRSQRTNDPGVCQTDLGRWSSE